MTKRSLFAVLLLCLATLSAAHAAVSLVVVEGRGVKLTPGQTIDGSQALTLLEGQQVSLISPTGKMIKLRGPYNEPPVKDESAEKVDVGAAMQALLTQKVARADRAGVVRGQQNQVVPPEPWLLDVTHPGTRCLPADSRIVFWRPQGGTDEELVTTPSDRSWRARAVWPAKDDRIMLPSTVPVTSRASYVVKLGKKEVTVTLLTLPAALSNDAMRAAWMMEKGCDTQALALLNPVQPAPRAPVRKE